MPFSQPPAAPQIAQAMGLLPAAGRAYRRRVLKNFPAFRADDYQTIKATYGYSYTYPQAFGIDWQAGQVFIARSPSGGSNAWNWIEVYAYATGQYLGTFSAGSNTGEGLEIVTNGSQRLLWARADTLGSLAAFDITALPANLSRLSPVSTVALDLYLDFSFNQNAGVAVVEERSTALGSFTRRNRFIKYRLSDWTRLGEQVFSVFDTGLGTTVGQTPESDLIPKRQGIVLGDGFYVSMMGANYQDGTAGGAVPMQYTGPKMFGPNGLKIADGVCDPQAVIALFKAAGYATITHMEVEGAVIAPAGQALVTPGTVISLAVTQNQADAAATSGGIFLIEEFSKDPGAIDVSAAARAYTAMDLSGASFMYPKGTSALYNLLTGAPFAGLAAVLDFMAHLDMARLEFYSTSVPFADLTGTAFPASTDIRLENRNNGTFWMVLTGAARSKEYLITGTPGSGGASNYVPGTWSQFLERQSRRPYASGRWVPPAGPTVLTSAPVNPGTGRIVLVPGTLRARVGIAQMGLRISTLAAGGNVQMGLYAPISDGNPLPGKFLCRTPSLSTAATGLVSAAPVAIDGSALATPSVDPDDLWWAFAVDNATVLFESFAAGSLGAVEIVGGATAAEALSAAAGALGGYSVSSVGGTAVAFGTWPADLTGATLTGLSGTSIPVPLIQAA